MRILNMPDIGAGVTDFWDYIREPRPHRWTAAALAFTVTGFIMWLFSYSMAPPVEPRGQIVYVESWPLERTEYDTRRAWLNRARAANDANQRRRDAYGSFARTIGQGYDKDAANREFDEARATIDQALADLDAAEKAGLPVPPLPAAEPDNRTPRTGTVSATAPNSPSRATPAKSADAAPQTAPTQSQ